MPQYFLSYARADSQFALKLGDDLRASGVDIWIDQKDIKPSTRWDRAIEAALRDCAAVVVVLSPRSVASENVLDEVGFAIDSGKSVIPVLIEACDIPIRLSRLQRVDFTGDYAAALDRCRMVLGGIDPELVQRAEAELTAYLGPLASKLVEVDLMESRNAADFYQKLASHILNPVKRAAFLKNAPAENGARRPAAPGRQSVSATPAVVFSQPLLEAVTLEVTKILGPIAVHLVKQASRQARDAEDLCERVASHVANVQEREKLLKRLRAL
jgi:hypothetical protein